MVRFTLNGAQVDLSREEVERRLAEVVPEPIREHGVRVGGSIYPVKQAFEVGTGISRSGFTSQTARRHLAALGFDIMSSGVPVAIPAVPRPVRVSTSPDDPHRWPWEGEVQALFGAFLNQQGWLVTSMADTATKAHGVDLLARRGDRRLGAEVKGWPSTDYADPRRAHEVKRTQPTTQAGHWFSQGLMKALMLLDSHPGHDSLLVLPNYPRYRDLAERTRTGRAAAGVHVVFVTAEGDADSSTWTP